MIRTALVVAGLASALLAGVAAPDAVAREIAIYIAPPPPRYEVVPAPRRGVAWVPGYWAWRGRHHVWVSGYWVRERRGYVYNQPTWIQRGDRWVWGPGGWRRVPTGPPPVEGATSTDRSNLP